MSLNGRVESQLVLLQPKMIFDRHNSRLPHNSLSKTNNNLFAGIGNELHQYVLTASNGTIHRKIDIKFTSKIYGIATLTTPSDRQTPFFVIHAGREIAIGSIDATNTVTIIQKLLINDWISSVRVYPASNQNECRFCALSGHNLAMEFIVSASGAWQIVNKSACVDKCTLYCSYVRGTQWTDTTCFGGNAFGELIIWTVGANGSTRNVLHRLSGHNVSLPVFRDFVVIIKEHTSTFLYP